MWNKKNIIEFNLEKELIGTIPEVNKSNKFFPNWFKKLKKDMPGTNRVSAGTVKTCIPFLDAMSLGYIIPAWSDILVDVTENYALLNHKGEEVGNFNNKPHDSDPKKMIGEVIEGHPISDVKLNGKSIMISLPESLVLNLNVHAKNENIGRHGWSQVGDQCSLKKFEFGKDLFKLGNPWSIKTPKGWSCYFKNVPNNWENDIEFIEGAVDTDTYNTQINFPFVWRGDELGEFFIPRGTPLIHVIPYKREVTEIKRGVIDKEAVHNQVLKLNTMFRDKYKKLFWHKRKEE